MIHDHKPTFDAVPIASLGLDDVETGMLAVLRHFLSALAGTAPQGWVTAMEVAAERWGLADGPRIAHGLVEVLQAVRRARRAAFSFANPLCLTCRTFATADEAALMAMLHWMRRDRTGPARDAVAQVAEGRHDAGLIRAGLALAGRHPAGHETPARQAGLRLVH